MRVCSLRRMKDHSVVAPFDDGPTKPNRASFPNRAGPNRGARNTRGLRLLFYKTGYHATRHALRLARDKMCRRHARARPGTDPRASPRGVGKGRPVMTWANSFAKSFTFQKNSLSSFFHCYFLDARVLVPAVPRVSRVRELWCSPMRLQSQWC